jgi:hypothetical protein
MKALTVLSAVLLALAVWGCADTELVPTVTSTVPTDDRLSVSGSFCTDVPTPAEFPVRILFVADISQSMNVSDPPPAVCPTAACLSRRGNAVQSILTKYPPGDGVSYGLISFSSDSAILTRDGAGLGGFTTDANQVLTSLPSLSSAVGETNFAGALKTTYEMLQADMIALDATARGRARYVVVFISDGLPSPRTSDQGLPTEVRTAVSDIAGLQRQQRLAEIAFHTIYLAGPDTPPAVQLVAKELLAEMSRIGNGSFRAFESTEEINLFYVDFTSFMRRFALKRLVVSNINEKPVDDRNGLDTDGDGLLDEEERSIGSSPALVDTDGDGFSDLLEVRLHASGFDPLFPGDADCAGPKDKLDDDGDGLRNCEERYLGTSFRLIDSDADGFTDDAELRMGTNAAVADDLVDTDFDSAPNGTELLHHTDPLRNDVAAFSKVAYRTTMREVRDDKSPAGQLCYEFEAHNITLVPVAPVAGLQDGTNTILIRVATTPSDSPEDYGNHQVACVRPRYRAKPEMKVPVSGQMAVPPEAFKRPGVQPDGTEGFDAMRDCVVP